MKGQEHKGRLWLEKLQLEYKKIILGMKN